MISVGFNARHLAYPEMRGLTRYTVELLRALSRIGSLRLTLFTDIPPHAGHLDGIDAEVVTFGASKQLFWEQRALPKKIKKLGIDVFHAPADRGLPFARVCPLVVTVHGSHERAHWRSRYPGWKRKLRYWLHEGVNYFRSDAIITVSDSTRKELISSRIAPDKKVIRVFNGVGKQFDSVGKPDDERTIAGYGVRSPYVLYVGGYNSWKNVDGLIRGFDRSGLSSYQLVIVARKSADFDRQLPVWQRRGCFERIHFIEVLDNELSCFYRCAEFFVNPSLWESFSLQLLEAMACGTPVISSNRKALPEILDDAGIYFDPEDDSALPACMRQMSQDANLRGTVRQCADSKGPGICPGSGRRMKRFPYTKESPITAEGRVDTIKEDKANLPLQDSGDEARAISGYRRLTSLPIKSIAEHSKWSISIGICTGRDPFSLACPTDPVLTASDVTDVPALYVADPFIVNQNGAWAMLFEVLNASTGKGEIALASSPDGFEWKYERVVLSEPFHLAYPYVFRHQGEYYMIPEACWTSSVRLYKAAEFPGKWVFVKELIRDVNFYSDASVIHHDGKWWMFVLRGWNELALLFCDELTGNWVEHPYSPIVSRNAHISRPGGRMLVFNDKLIRYTQDCYPIYGNQVRAFEIDTLTSTQYAEHPIANNPVVRGSGFGWNRDGMHHVDAHRLGPDEWIACVDGLRLGRWYENPVGFARAVYLAMKANGNHMRSTASEKPGVTLHHAGL